MTMTPKQIGEQLVAVQSALVEKIEVQPWIAPSVAIRSSGDCTISLYGDLNKHGSNAMETAKGKSFEHLFKDAFRIISAMPDANTIAKKKFHKNLANVIDEGNGLNLPDDVMAPLNGSMKAMSENLLTHTPEPSK